MDAATGAHTVAEVAPDGSVARTTVDAKGRVVAKRQTAPDGLARGMALTFDAQGRLTEVQQGGAPLHVEDRRDEQGRLVRTVRSGPVVKSAVFDGERVVVRADGVDGRARRSIVAATRFDFAEQTDAAGRLWTKTHDAAGRLLSSKAPDGRETRYRYDERGNMLERITPEGTYAFAYDAHHRVIRETKPGGATLSYVRDADGRVIEQTDAQGNRTKFEYNAMGQTTAHIGPFGPDEPEPPAQRFEYDVWGNLTASFDEAGHATRYAYDGMNRLVQRVDAAGAATTYAYDGFGRKTKEVDALGGTTEWVYDERGLMVEVKGSQTGVSGPMAGRTTCGSCGGASGVYDKPGTYAYNEARLLTKYVDALGHETTYEYNDLGQQVAVTDALGAVTRYEYDPDGNLLATTDPLGAVTRNEYDALGRLTAVVDPLGRRTRYAYDAEGRQTAAIAPDGATTRTEYDALGRVTKTVAPHGAATNYHYDVEGKLVRQTDALGVSTAYLYDARGRRVQTIRDADGLLKNTTRQHYDAHGRLASTVDPLGRVTRYAYDILGRMTKMTSPSGAETTFEYDALGRQVRVTDPVGRQRVTEYAPGHDQPAATGRGQGWVAWFEYDALGRRTTSTGLDLPREETTFDAVGRVVSTKRGGSTTTMAYDASGRLVSTTGPLGATTRYEYNAAGQLLSVTDALGATTRFEYDAGGRQVKTHLPGGGTRENVYNEAGQLVETRGGPEGTKRYEYDLLGRRTAEINALGGRKTTEYDALGRVVRIANEMDQPVTYGYDASGNRTALTDANGNTTTWTYDEDNRATSMTYANGDREEYQYDASGKLTQKKTPNGEYIRMTYDANGFLTKVDVEGDVPYIRDLYTKLLADAKAANLPVEDIDFTQRNFTVEYTRDAQGRVIKQQCPETTMLFSYTKSGQISSSTNTGYGGSLRYGYDTIGRRIRIEGDIEFPVNYYYDKDHNLTRMEIGDQWFIDYKYNSGKHLARKTFSNGVSTEYRYDDSGQLELVQTEKLALRETFTRNNIGMIVERDRVPQRKYSYKYDNAGRLIHETDSITGEQKKDSTDTYAYDQVGNRIAHERIGSDPYQSTTEYNSANQLTSSSVTWRNDENLTVNETEVAIFDKNGNCVATYGKTANGLKIQSIHVYDSMNRLLSRHSVSRTDRFRYVGAGHKQSRRETDVYSPDNAIFSRTAVKILHDGSKEIAAKSDNERVVKFFGATDEAVLNIRIRGAGREDAWPLFVVTDYQQSKTAYVDMQGEIFRGRYLYKSFGEYIEQGNGVSYTSSLYDFDTPSYTGARYADWRPGTIDFAYRTYDTKTGRFNSRDPLGYRANRFGNLYDYCNCDPINQIDQMGLSPISVAALYNPIVDEARDVIISNIILKDLELKSNPIAKCTGASDFLNTIYRFLITRPYTNFSWNPNITASFYFTYNKVLYLRLDAGFSEMIHEATHAWDHKNNITGIHGHLELADFAVGEKLGYSVEHAFSYIDALFDHYNKLATFMYDGRCEDAKNESVKKLKTFFGNPLSHEYSFSAQGIVIPLYQEDIERSLKRHFPFKLSCLCDTLSSQIGKNITNCCFSCDEYINSGELHKW